MDFKEDLNLVKGKLEDETKNLVQEPINTEGKVVGTPDEYDEKTPIVEDAQTKSVTVRENDNFAMQTNNNSFISAMADNSVAMEMAKESYNALKNQKKIGKKIEDVVKSNTEVDIESAAIKVKEKDKNNKVKKAEINNELLRLKNERIYLEKEQKHKLQMQRAEHIRDKYEDLLLRTCRKRQKGEDGKWHYVLDKNGKEIVNIPGRFRFFWLRLFDGIISTLNQTAEIFGALNKNVLKGGIIIIILALLFIPPFREWLLGLIGINLG